LSDLVNSAIEQRCRSGETLTAAELDELGTVDVLSLGMLADEVRRARVGDTVTYARDAESRLTTLPATLDETLSAIREAKAAAPEVVGFSLADIIDRCRGPHDADSASWGGQWGPLQDVLAQLAKAGLTAIAEAPIDRIADMTTALHAAGQAGLPVECLSLQKPWTESRTDYVLKVRSIVEQFPSIQTVAPLPREQSIAVPTTGYDDVRAVALARLGLPAVKRIQVDWSQYGPKLAQVALTFGANDLDRVSTVDDESLGRRRTSVEDVRRNVAAAGFTAIER
jgi:aminodeoxyfutalosine synthase